MGLDGDRSIGMPKSSLETSSKSEFSDSEFVFGGVKFNGGIDMGDRGGERDGDLGGYVDLGGGEREMGIWVVEGRGEGDLGGRDLYLFHQERRVLGESGGGIGITGEPRCCGEGDREGVGIFAYFEIQGEFWEKVVDELVLQGNLHVVVHLCFSLDL